MTTFVQSNCDLPTLILSYVDNKSLYFHLEQISTSTDITPKAKEIINAAKDQLFEDCGDVETYQKAFENLSVNDLACKLLAAVCNMNFAQVEAILGMNKIPKDCSKTGNICGNFCYVNTTDENAHRMLKMLIDYGFDWRYGNYRPCQFAITNIEFPKVVELFLDSGLDVDHTFGGGLSLISLAIGHKRDAIVRLLIERGAKISDASKKKLSSELQKLVKERDAAKAVVFVTKQQDVNNQLDALVKQITSHPSFVKSSVKVTDFYHRHILKFANEYNSTSEDFVVDFDSDSSMLTVTWKE